MPFSIKNGIKLFFVLIFFSSFLSSSWQVKLIDDTLKALKKTTKRVGRVRSDDLVDNIRFQIEVFGAQETRVSIEAEIKIAKQLGDNVKLSKEYSNLSIVYKHMGDYNLAIKSAESSLEELIKLYGRNDFKVLSLFLSIGLMHQRTKNFKKEKPYILAIENGLNYLTDRDKIIFQDTLIAYYKNKNDLKKVEKYTKNSLKINLKLYGDNNQEVFDISNTLSMIYFDMNKLILAEEYALKSLNIYQHMTKELYNDSNILPIIKRPFNLIKTYINLTKVYLQQNKQEEALKYALKSLKHKEIKTHELAMTHYLLSKIYFNLNIVKESKKSAIKAFEIFKEYREKVFSNSSERVKKEYSEKYRDYIDNLFIIYHQNIAYRDNKEFFQEIFNYWINIKGEIAYQENCISSITKNASIIHHLNKKLEESKKAYSDSSILDELRQEKNETKIIQLVEKMERARARVAVHSILSTLNVIPDKIDHSDISSLLNKKQIYIDYIKTANNYYVFIINGNGIITFDLIDIDRIKIDKEIQRLRALIEDKKNIKKVSNYLYKQLLSKPIKKRLESYNSLIISTDGLLNFIPFEALYTEKKKFLVEDKEILYISSAKAFRQRVKNENLVQNSGKVIVFANPNYDKGLNLKSENNVSIDANGSKSLKDLFGYLEPLPFSQQEADTIKTIYEDNSTIFTENSATEENLFKISSPKILHLSTHAISVEDNRPMVDPLQKSIIAFSGYNNSVEKNQNRGIVSALKFSNLNLIGTELVFFSACQTGLGDMHTGEGITSLNTSAIQAGAKRVISTLWSVADKESSIVVKEFYQNLQYRTYATALRESKLMMINHENTEYHHPFYWAGFVLNGVN